MKKRAPYGALVSTDSSVRHLWHTRFAELPELPIHDLPEHDTLEELETRELVQYALSGPPSRAIDVAVLHTVDGYTLEEIGVQMGITRERVRQLELRGLRMLARRLLGALHPRARSVQ